MPASPEEENMSGIHNDPQGGSAGCEDLQNPIWVDAFEGFRQIKGKNCAR
jgi:hypothetical protein